MITQTKALMLLLALSSSYALAQVSSVTRNIARYTQDVFAYKGSRMLQVDEVSAGKVEDNVFIFSKGEKFAIKKISDLLLAKINITKMIR